MTPQLLQQCVGSFVHWTQPDPPVVPHHFGASTPTFGGGSEAGAVMRLPFTDSAPAFANCLPFAEHGPVEQYDPQSYA